MCSLVVFVSCLVLASAATVPLRGNIGRFLNSRIVNGVEATPGELPYQVSLLVDNFHLCGGSVIANGWVVTAAHCVYGQNISRLSVVADLHDFENPGDSIKWINIGEIIMHEQFNQGDGAYPNDIALIRLELDGHDISGNIITVADGSNSFVGETCVLSGWGITELGDGSNQLRKTEVVALSESECAGYWGAGNILAQQICVKGYSNPNGSGACNFDNGGPLVCSEVLAGVISWGDSDCNTGSVNFATVVASTGYFHNWINSKCNCL